MRVRSFILTILCFSLFLILVSSRWPEAVNMVINTMADMRPTVVVSAMDDMADSLQNGTRFMDAVKHAVQCLVQEAGFVSG